MGKFSFSWATDWNPKLLRKQRSPPNRVTIVTDGKEGPDKTLQVEPGGHVPIRLQHDSLLAIGEKGVTNIPGIAKREREWKISGCTEVTRRFWDNEECIWGGEGERESPRRPPWTAKHKTCGWERREKSVIILCSTQEVDKTGISVENLTTKAFCAA